MNHILKNILITMCLAIVFALVIKNYLEILLQTRNASQHAAEAVLDTLRSDVAQHKVQLEQVVSSAIAKALPQLSAGAGATGGAVPPAPKGKGLPVDVIPAEHAVRSSRQDSMASVDSHCHDPGQRDRDFTNVLSV
eukprot:scaffold178401_cov22-Prasinocladus_malaysianus.AAC.1